ncbi:hypothetical protein ELQ35_15135 [Peribacillus cavernae]|uniref:FTR1 family iron permease n=1 Tax=Peribacillus cavernae TaxID=1674310 RepID=A0A3S0TZA9_9BACI|nr:FTR1 family protein [Peribacillus cavernae]MDQ0220248.1 high-affinity iron transporter [Peribacillus cavernae]RUQ27660.1 hypothetical protein ELQ35_15135 [Peribacillus cavernae]
MRAVNRNRHLLMIIAFLMLFSFFMPHGQAAENHDELFVYIGDSLMKAKEGDLEAVSKNIDSFDTEWKAIKKPDSKQAEAVDQNIEKVKKAIQKGDTEELNSPLSALSNSVVQYEKEQNPVDKEKEKKRLKALLPLLDEMASTVSAGDIAKVKSQYGGLLNKWTAAEKIVRIESVASYGEIEKYMALIRIAITQEPADQEKAATNIKELKRSINNFLSGNVKQARHASYSLSDVTQLLTDSMNSIEDQDLDTASSKLNEILNIWPMVEGDVKTRDNKLYSDVETKVPTAISFLESKKANTEEAKSIIEDLNDRLRPLTEKTSYSVWDAALILLREGLEALLIVATLLSFLKKVNQADKQKWIWFGVAAGLLSGAILAVIINMLFSQLNAASNREYIEGVTGIVAVIMMLTVGAWLHSKSNIGSWSRYINKQMGEAIATGNLFSFALISFLSIFREGAETIIFYTGMAPYMSLDQLLIGIGIALLILSIIGYLIIKYSVKIPISLFFTVATVLIYVVAFKILGMSIHSLQVSQAVATHTIHPFPFIEWLGLYPTWETLVPQIILLVIILIMTNWINRKNQTQTKEVPQ